ncbi:I78 family peptidase inhibitor [Luteimonas sp. RD2P54]|uniref:I78 family peptidase inhibitor n=1 Tax=Luteimonas endophytica TaxID=3042023 RepID=A0ABT6J4T3_9GAMM|nr:I78 family peptidase inhibitor [Luteimonas endophytica]MDH5821831.1 I78 family peptidase inhibitor [Luteimonas endophytica]
MPRFAASLLFAALTVSLAACAPARNAADETGASAADASPPAASADAGATPAPRAQDAGGDCDASAVQSLVGQRADASVVEQARNGAGAEVARVLKPDQMVTMEFRAGRLNIDVDDDGVITALRCG